MSIQRFSVRMAGVGFEWYADDNGPWVSAEACEMAVRSARAEGVKEGKSVPVNWPQAYNDAVDDCISALEFMDKHPHGLIDAAAAIACLRTIGGSDD